MVQFRQLLYLLPLFVALFGCSLATDGRFEVTAVTESAALRPTETPLPPSPDTATATLPVPTVTPTLTNTPVPTVAPPTPFPTAIPTATPVPRTDLAFSSYGLLIYPAPEVYTGERVTFQVLAHVPQPLAPTDVGVHILVNDQLVVNDTLNWRNLGGDAVGLYAWVWETDEADDYAVTVVLDPANTIVVGDEDSDNNQLTVTMPVRPASDLPPAVADAAWITVQNNCCNVHVVSSTAAHRDLKELVVLVDEAVQTAAERLNEQPDRVLDVYLIDKVIGQGGYAGSSMVVSYLDRNYSGGGLYEVLIHEAIHLIDRQFAPNRITFLAEGVAVWGAGGHYKQENLDQRAAAVLESDLYIPLEELINDFYPAQHEIGYLQAASFVSYLVNSYGWEAVRAFYSDVTAESGETLVQAMEVKVQEHFDTSLVEAEANWLRYLADLPRDRTAVADLHTTIRYYEVVRRYQSLYDPTAYFLVAWLPAPEELLRRGTMAELTRRSSAEVNVALETMLVATDAALMAGEYNRANGLLDSVSRVLDHDGAFLDPLAMHYQGIVRSAAGLGYEVQQIDLSGDRATVLATAPGRVNLVQLNLSLNNQTWVLSR